MSFLILSARECPGKLRMTVLRGLYGTWPMNTVCLWPFDTFLAYTVSA